MRRKLYWLSLCVALACVFPTGQTVAAERGFLGVNLGALNDAWREKLDCEGQGVVVLKVFVKSAAEKAGIQEGDVITSIDGEAVSSAADVMRLIKEKEADDVVTIDVLRKGDKVSLSAKLHKMGISLSNVKVGSRCFPSDMNVFGNTKVKGHILAGKVSGKWWMGVHTLSLGKQLAEHFGVENGVLVQKVVDGSPAEDAGVLAGDIILQANGSAVNSPFDLKRAVKKASITKGDDAVVRLDIHRKGAPVEISVPVGQRPGGDKASWDVRTLGKMGEALKFGKVGPITFSWNGETRTIDLPGENGASFSFGEGGFGRMIDEVRENLNLTRKAKGKVKDLKNDIEELREEIRGLKNEIKEFRELVEKDR